MKIGEIYKKFKVPPNLQEHHLWVAKMAMFIVDHWQGPKIDQIIIKKEALLHDLGNIVKFDFDKHPEFLGSEQKRINYWINVQKEIIEKYGHEDHRATAEMLKEIAVDPKIIGLILAKSFIKALDIENSNIWELKILLYADLRVGPFGVISLKERLKEALNRYAPQEKNKWLVQTEACQRIERHIQENINVEVINLVENQLTRENGELLNTEI